MFAPYTSLDKCLGKEIHVRFGGDNYVGMLAGIYYMGQTPVLVITPMAGAGTEQHIPLPNAVVTVKAG